MVSEAREIEEAEVGSPRLYAIALYAVRRNAPEPVIGLLPGATLAVSDDAALEAGSKKSPSACFPRAEGWSEHQVSLNTAFRALFVAAWFS